MQSVIKWYTTRTIADQVEAGPPVHNAVITHWIFINKAFESADFDFRVANLVTEAEWEVEHGSPAAYVVSSFQ